MNIATKNEQVPVSDARKKAYRLLGIAKNQLAKVRPGFSDEDYRHILFNFNVVMYNILHDVSLYINTNSS